MGRPLNMISSFQLKKQIYKNYKENMLDEQLGKNYLLSSKWCSENITINNIELQKK